MNFNYKSISDAPSYTALRAYILPKGRLAYVKTFGCQQNEADSERIVGILLDLGFRMTEDASCADLIILNTCSVRAHAEDKVFSTLGGFKEYRRKNPELIIGVVGCMGANSAAVDKLRRDFHYVSFTLGAGVMHKLPEVLYGIISGGGRKFVEPDPRENIVEGIPVKRVSDKTAYVSIMYGCNNFCSYCIVPYTRGRERSRCSADIIAECRELISSGVCEITLLGQNVNSYSADISFPELLSAIVRLEGKFILRFMTSHPKDVSAELVRVMGKYPEKIAPAFHLPLQSGSDRVLLDMNRRYTKQSFIDTADMIKAGVTDVYLTTDVIVGYPGESEEDFIETLDVLSRVRFDAVYAFLYSPREGTVAARRADTVEHSVKKRRLSQLLQLQDEILISKNRELIGRVFTVLCESCEGETSRGRACSGRPVYFDRKNAAPGKYVKVKITSVGAYGLVGCEVE